MAAFPGEEKNASIFVNFLVEYQKFIESAGSCVSEQDVNQTNDENGVTVDIPDNAGGLSLFF